MTVAAAPEAPLPPTHAPGGPVLDIAVVGSGISGLAAGWLLSQRHRVTVYEADSRAGGHSNTVQVGAGPGAIAVDTGFIVYNESAYPNLTALFAHLGVATQPAEMSFAVSLDGGALEYSGSGLRGLFAQRANLVRPRFWSMLRELVRFYRQAPGEAARFGLAPLDSYLDARGYGRAFREDHLYPMAAAIWSTPAARIGDYPTEAFVRFCENHHLLNLGDRPAWRTVTGGSARYVARLAEGIGEPLRLDSAVLELRREAGGVFVRTERAAAPRRFDHVVIAAHADQALRLLPDATADETRLLGAFGYSRNRAVLHSDPALMPRRRAVWSSWNYAADRRRDGAPCVTYWMNRLQGIADDTPLFLTLNPAQEPAREHLIRSEVYEHPVFDPHAMRAQDELWSLQGQRRTWFCGAYFGAGFHEDGLQAGLAVAEALGGVRRPWTVADESGRIRLRSTLAAEALA
ncbi:putative NAD/FAD-binding protein [Variovorax sp. TBS-050B]|uniref:NAD(P)/FAD-dependent oxidoreductase n=1 Tax=Variovorax sp. TBS-050B TaxID=2940551 RepID=UPI002475663B|nr:FAD-dependent oxidoreductase [Variovorax sp. TBS-050B]MDH6593418.1 putative NAD/FAD-binding protein [Variovorax sp. TBS-050B]